MSRFAAHSLSWSMIKKSSHEFSIVEACCLEIPHVSMRSAHYYYITTLPALGQLGSSPSMGLADLLEHIQQDRSLREPLETILLLDDLLQREALLSGETDSVEPVVLSRQQAQGEAPLPESLQITSITYQANSLQSDILWEQYFRYAHQMARSHGNRFLLQWVEFEVALRNALAISRAGRLGLEESKYQVALDLASSDEDFFLLLSEWELAPTPLAGLRTVIRARWSWLDRHDCWFSFSTEELLAYAVRVMLMEQWCRTTREDEGPV